MTIPGELRALLRDATARQRIWLALILSTYIGLGSWGCSYIGTVMGRLVPVRRDVIDKRIVRIEKLVVPVPPRKNYPPLSIPQDACKGAPVVIEAIEVAGWQGQKEGDTDVKTYMTVRPVGDDYTVQCQVGGDYTFGWHKGDLVRMFGGELSS